MLSLRASIIFFSSNDSFFPILYFPVSNSFSSGQFPSSDTSSMF